jgi:hypothetical protein
MTRGLIALALLLAFVALPAEAQKVYIDFDQNADFDSYQTFAWGPTPEASLKESSPLMHSRIKNAIEYQLTTGDMIEDTENPDVYVTYHGDSDSKMNINTSHWGYGYGGGWAWDPYYGSGFGSSTSTVYEYDVGTLIVDIWDAKTKELVWRASATKTIPSKPEKQAKLIDDMVAKMAREWEKKKKKMDR